MARDTAAATIAAGPGLALAAAGHAGKQAGDDDHKK
jgi:hypothetical protein